MNINTELLEDHQARIVLEVDPEPFESAKHRAARKIANSTKIPGFRPGKAPYAMVVRHVGEPAVVEEAINILVDDVYPKAIEEAKIDPYGPGILENVEKLDPLTLQFKVPLSPITELGDYHTLRIPYEPPTINTKQVDDTIESLRERQAIIEPVERPAQDGDVVYIRIIGERSSPNENEDPIVIKETPYAVVIEPADHTDSEEWPFVGFSQHMKGLSAGDEKDVLYTYPEDYDVERLKGIEIKFHVQVESVKSHTLPDLNDEFAQSVGDYTSLDALKIFVEEQLQKQATQDYDEDYEQEALDKVVEISSVKYPPQLLDEEISRVINHLNNRLKMEKADIELYMKARGIDMNALRDEARPVAEKQVKHTLVLMQIAHDENIQVSPEDVFSETNKTMDVLSRSLSKKDSRLLSTDVTKQQITENVIFDMVSKNSLQRLHDIVSGKEITASDSMKEDNPSTDEPVKPKKKPRTKKKVEE